MKRLLLAVLALYFVGCWLPDIPWPPPTPTPTPQPTPTPEPTPEPTPTPTPSPTPTPEPTPEPTPTPTPEECLALTHIKIVGFCAGINPHGCFANGRDWNNPPILNVAGKKNIYLSATYMAGEEEIHAYDACYPGGLRADAWSEQVIVGDHIDTGTPWSDGHNLTLYDLDFRTRNKFTVCGRGACGETVVTVR